jgi:hypothetical protein
VHIHIVVSFEVGGAEVGRLAARRHGLHTRARKPRSADRTPSELDGHADQENDSARSKSHDHHIPKRLPDERFVDESSSSLKSAFPGVRRKPCLEQTRPYGGFLETAWEDAGRYAILQ